MASNFDGLKHIASDSTEGDRLTPEFFKRAIDAIMRPESYWRGVERMSRVETATTIAYVAFKENRINAQEFAQVMQSIGFEGYILANATICKKLAPVAERYETEEDRREAEEARQQWQEALSKLV